jgi:NAD+ kinase
LVVTPVCAHSLHARPLVIGANDSIAVKVLAPHDEVMLVADGQEAVNLQPGETIRFGRAEAVTRLVRFSEQSFYDVLRQRLKEGKI